MSVVTLPRCVVCRGHYYKDRMPVKVPRTQGPDARAKSSRQVLKVMSLGRGGASLSKRCAARKRAWGRERGVATRPACHLLCELEPGGAGGAGRGGRRAEPYPWAWTSGQAAGALCCVGTNGRRHPNDTMVCPGVHLQRLPMLFLFLEMVKRKDISYNYSISLNIWQNLLHFWEWPSSDAVKQLSLDLDYVIISKG